VTLPLNAGDDGPKRPWFDDDAIAVGDGPADFAPSLVSVGFIRAALRRSARFWRGMAVIGLLAGAGLYLASPPTYQASTTLLLTVGPEAQPGTVILNDQTIAQSRGVAGLAVHNLGLRQSVGSFLGSYKATPLTDRVLLITASAPSSNEAVRRANALAQAFLTFRADELQTQQQLESAGYDQQITQVKNHIKSISDQISQLAAQPVSSSQQAKLSALRAQRDGANSDLTALKQATAADKAATQVSTASMIGKSKVLDAASPLPPHSRPKHLILYAVAGFMLGLILGVSIVVVRALVSDRLRRRDDVARALGAPVKLSVSAMRVKRRFLSRPGLAAARGRDMQRIVAHLRDAVPKSSRGPAALAVVPIDDPQVAALSVASLAVSCAQQGKRVVVADLCRGAPAATLLGTKDPGVHTVSLDGAHLAVAVPDPDEVAPAGPFSPMPPQAQPTLASQVAAACASADLLLTLVALDPSVGGDHLATWAADAVVVVTAGRSSWTKIQSVGEMIRLAGTHLVSAVLVGADKTDESLGVTPAPEAGRAAIAGEAGRAAIAGEGSHSGGRGSSVTVDSGPRGDPSDDAPMSTRFMSR
jgi:capsular polysaccharide biosynthesis protein